MTAHTSAESEATGEDWVDPDPDLTAPAPQRWRARTAA